MGATKSGGKKRVGKRKSRAHKVYIDPNPANLALPADELRQLVLRIVCRDDVKTFVGRMVKLLDGLKAGCGGTLARVARQSEDRDFGRLVAALARVVKRGDVVAARETAFFAASYAYQNSLEYMLELMRYLDGFRASRG